MNILICYPGTIEKSGGMQFICAQFANAMHGRGHRVAVCWYGSNKIKSFYHYSNQIMFFSLRPSRIPLAMDYHDVGKDVPFMSKTVRETLRLFSKKAYRKWNDHCKQEILFPQLQEIVHTFQPDVIISFSSDMTRFLGTIIERIPTISMIHTDPSHVFEDSYFGEIAALRKSYAIQVLSPSYIQLVKQYCPETRIVYIPNPVKQVRPLADLSKNKDKYYIIDVARINKNKQQHVLIEAFARLAEYFPEWNLELWGDNKTYSTYVNSLMQLIRKYHLENKVTLCGITNNVEEVYRKADIFAFPSAYEGFGLALVEAMSAWLPALAFKTCTSVNELIKDGRTGFLVDEDVDSFANKLKYLMKNKDVRIQLGKNAQLEAEKYAPAHVWSAWEKLLDDAKLSLG
ncbi:glycosyltransferase [Dialister sp.]|uniref:glycosyltransferase n=1 Tax=Dialister sp. TaxID=1955814 RepID=UPI003F07955E